MCTDKTRLIPEDTRDAAAGLKITIAVLDLGKLIFDSIFIGISKPNEGAGADADGGAGTADVIQNIGSIAFTVLDFAFSYAVGYHCYSPMDPDSKYADTEYAKKIQKAENCAEKYTICWWVKTPFSLFCDIYDLIAMVKKIETKEEIKTVASALKIVIYGVSAVIEVSGCIEAGKVNADNSDFLDEEADRKIFISDTAGYVTSDILGILDEVYNLGLKGLLASIPAKVIYIIARAVPAAGSIVTQSLSAKYILEQKK